MPRVTLNASVASHALSAYDQLAASNAALVGALEHITKLNAEDPGDCLVAIKIASAALASARQANKARLKTDAEARVHD